MLTTELTIQSMLTHLNRRVLTTLRLTIQTIFQFIKAKMVVMLQALPISAMDSLAPMMMTALVAVADILSPSP